MKTFTLIHVAISLVAILSGFVVTGFFFPFHGITPAIVTGIISLVVLAIAIFARYSRNLARAWRKTYVISALLALYFNVVVLVVQAFQKIPALKELAPTQNDPPFKIVQLMVLALFIALGIATTIRFRVHPVSAGSETALPVDASGF